MAGFAAVQWRTRRQAVSAALAALLVSLALAASRWDASALWFAVASGAGVAGLCALRGRFARCSGPAIAADAILIAIVFLRVTGKRGRTC